MSEAPYEKAPLTLDSALQNELQRLFDECKSDVAVEVGGLTMNGIAAITTLASRFVQFLTENDPDGSLLIDFMANFRKKALSIISEMFYKEFRHASLAFYHDIILTFSSACIEAVGRRLKNDKNILETRRKAAESASSISRSVDVVLDSSTVDKPGDDLDGGGAGEDSL